MVQVTEKCSLAASERPGLQPVCSQGGRQERASSTQRERQRQSSRRRSGAERRQANDERQHLRLAVASGRNLYVGRAGRPTTCQPDGGAGCHARLHAAYAAARLTVAAHRRCSPSRPRPALVCRCAAPLSRSRSRRSTTCCRTALLTTSSSSFFLGRVRFTSASGASVLHLVQAGRASLVARSLTRPDAQRADQARTE